MEHLYIPGLKMTPIVLPTSICCPRKKAKQLQNHEAFKKTKSILFGLSIRDKTSNGIKNRELLLAKFEKMYHLGVRSFGVFFDDISGEGTNPVKQAELLNYIDEHFVKVKPDVTPLIMCPHRIQ